MTYISNTGDERRQMLDVIGAESVEDLFTGIPDRHYLVIEPSKITGSSDEAVATKAHNSSGNDGYVGFLHRHFVTVLL